MQYSPKVEWFVNRVQYTGDDKEDLRRIFIVSFILGTLLLAFVPIVYNSSSGSYVLYAREFLGMEDHPEIYFRTWGYPLLLIVSGVFKLDTFWGVALIQYAMAITIPIFIFRTISIYESKTAYYLSLFSIVSLVPYGFMKAIMTEQSYIFFLIVCLYYASKFFATQRIYYVYMTCLFMSILSLIRPTGDYVFLIFVIVIVTYIHRWKRSVFIHLVISIVGILVLFQGWSYVRVAVFDGLTPKMFNQTNVTGKFLFYNVYLSGGHYNNRILFVGGQFEKKFLINEIDGPASKAFVNALRTALENIEFTKIKENLGMTQVGLGQLQNAFYFGYDTPQKLGDEILSAPSVPYHFFIWKLFDKAYGPEKADELLKNVSIEMLRLNPLMGLHYLARNIYFFCIGISMDYIYALHPNYNLKVMQPKMDGLVAYSPLSENPEIGLTKNLAQDLSFRLGGDWNTRIRAILFFYFWSSCYLIIRPFVFLFMLLGVIITLKEKYGPIGLLAFGIVLYHMLIVCGFQMPVDRYIMQTLLLEVIAAAPGIAFFVNKFRQTG